MNGILLVCDDMLFSSRITGTARALGIGIQTCRGSADALHQAKAECPHCVIVDLSTPGLDSATLVADIRAACSPAPFMAAFGSHVDTETLRAARAAGFDVVWPRSKFADELNVALPTWIARNQNGNV